MKRSSVALVTFFSVMTARAADVATTFHFSPTLANEGNPIVRLLGAGWTGLMLSNVAAVLVFLLVPLLLYWKWPPKRLADPPASVWDYASLCLYSKPMGRARLLAAMFLGWPLPRDRRQMVRFFGFTMSWAVVAGSWAAVLAWWAQCAWDWQAFNRLRAAVTLGSLPLLEISVSLLAALVATVVHFRLEHHEARQAFPSPGPL